MWNTCKLQSGFAVSIESQTEGEVAGRDWPCITLLLEIPEESVDFKILVMKKWDKACLVAVPY